MIGAPNLGADLIAAGLTFTGYAEGLPAPGSAVCGQGGYARKHAHWIAFRNLPQRGDRPVALVRGPICRTTGPEASDG